MIIYLTTQVRFCEIVPTEESVYGGLVNSANPIYKKQPQILTFSFSSEPSDCNVVKKGNSLSRGEYTFFQLGFVCTYKSSVAQW